MQLYALDSDNVISANHAVKQCDYICLECGGIVRLRGGMHRQNHFYHLEQTRRCRQNGKSMTHLAVQRFLEQKLPEGDCILEYHMPEINRIADVVWLSKRLVFEVQCSPITVREIQSRNADYWKQGFQVVWILHDKRYNHWRMTAAEQFLKSSPHYFTNIDVSGKGRIYDQLAEISQGKRVRVFRSYTIDITHPIRSFPNKRVDLLPKSVSHRIHYWTVCFSGDLINRSFFPNGETARDLEQAYNRERVRGFFSLLYRFFASFVQRPYRLALQLMLERACR